MKPHLPVKLFRALVGLMATSSMVCAAYVMVTNSGESGSAAVSVFDSSGDDGLTLDADSAVHVDVADTGSVTNLNQNKLTLKGGTSLKISNAGSGDGRVYTLFKGVSGLVDAQGNDIELNDSNNAISNYFDTSAPGTGFWSGATLQRTDDGDLQLVRHDETVKPAITITTRQTGSVNYSYYESVTFENINYSSTSDAIGGAIYAGDGTVTLSWNGAVTFSGNTASGTYASGGAICASDVTLSGNGEVTFSGNTASSTSSSAYGGAISAGRVTLSGNGAVTFSGNTASGGYAEGGAIDASGGTVTLSGNDFVTFSENIASGSGGAIYVGYSGMVTLSGNDFVTFSENIASGSGGAIYATTVTLSGNGAVTFSGNTASSTSSYANGGAIYADEVTLSGNGAVTFSGNNVTATGEAYSYAEGGAIYANGGTVTLSGNGDVTFSGNNVTATGEYSDADGGAIYAEDGTVTLSGNGDVTFSGNNVTATEEYSYANGGAIYADGGTVTLSGNGDVTFSGNTASGYFAHGGAIYAGTVTLSGNGDVTFSGNTASSTGSSVYGGAIRATTVTLSGNGDVLFEKNAEVANATYRLLRSIDTVNLNLSASEGKKIEFRDSIYASGRVKLNEGGAGNIIFTGATTEADLRSIKGSAGAVGKISDSRLSKLGHVELFGGSLMVQHQATLQSEVFMVKQAADATLVLENGHVDARHFIVNSGNTLSLKGKNTLSTGYGKIDGTMQFAVESTHAENALVSYSGFVDLSESSFDIQSTQTTASYQLLSLQKRSVVKWNDDLVFTASGIDSSRLVWKDGVLYWDISGNVTESKQVLGDYIFSTDWTLQHVTDKNQITGTGNLAFCLDSDVEWDGLASSLINNSSSHVFITGEQSADGKPLYSFDFDNATSRAFNVKTLMVADLKEVTFSGNSASSGGAIDASNNGTVTLSGNGAVTFSGNTVEYSGAAIHANEVTLSGNGAVTFSRNTAAYGGAIDASYGTVTLSGNGDVTFSVNSASSGGAIDAYGCTVTLSGNGAVTLSGNTASSTDYSAYGGAIDAYGGTVTLSGNGDVTFSENTASGSSASGGAIDARYGTVTLSWNGDVTFSGNNVTATGEEYSSAEGGAIYADGGTVTLSGNGAVTFSENTASGRSADGGAIYANGGTVTLSGNGDVTFSGNNVTATEEYSYANGGAIYVGYSGMVTLSGNDFVTFSENIASGSGGAIDANGGTVTLSGNGNVTFSENIASGSGGAIYANEVTLSGNGDVTLSGNTAEYGGAIDASTVTLSGNGAVTFSGNTASSTSSYARGGAISANEGTVTLSGNGDVTFSGNTASGSHDVYGGAIDAGYNGTVTLSGNGDVTFSGNTASSTDYYVEGGAIYANEVTLSGNGDVTFSENTASSTHHYADGGAISANGGTVTLSGNGDVLFEKNAEARNGTYRLRSIYTENLNLSASEGKKIEFRDSIYAYGTVNLNADYTDAKGVVHKQTGDIIFTGATTEADLLEVKGIAGTTDEITNSRTSIVESMTNLYGGRLRIEDGAIYQGKGLTVHENSAATVLLKDATMTHKGKSVSFASGTTLAVTGVSQLTADSLTMADGSAWAFEVSAANADKAVLTYSGVLTLRGKLSVNLTTNGALTEGASYQLLTGVAKPTNWTADNITVSSATAGWSVDFADLTWVDNTLWLYYDTRPDLTIATWTNESNDGLWNTSSVNWAQDEYDYAYQNGVQVVFGDEGAGTVTLVGELAPESVLVENSSGKDYIWNADAIEGGKLTGSMKLMKQGSGMLSINTANDYTGGTEINGGSLIAGSDMAFGIGDVTLNSGTLDLNDKGITNNIIANGGTLEGATQYGGNLTVNGDLEVGDNTTANSITVNKGDISGGSLTNTDITYTGDSNTSADITGDSSVTVEGGNATLSGDNSYTGGTVVNGGSLTAGSDTAFGTGVVTVNGGTLELNGKSISNDVFFNGGVLSGGSLDGVAITAQAGTLNSAITGESSLWVVSGISATDEVVLSADSEYQGGTTVDGGVLVLSAEGGFALGYGEVKVNGGTLRLDAAENCILSTIGGTGGKVDLNGNMLYMLDGVDSAYAGRMQNGGLYMEAFATQTFTGEVENVAFEVGSGSTLELLGETTLSTAVANSGTVTFGGTVNLTLEEESESELFYINVAGEISENGYTATSKTYLVVDGGSSSAADDTIWKENGVELLETVYDNGRLTSILRDLGTYYINSGSETVQDASIFGDAAISLKSGTLDLNGVTLANDIVATGGTLSGATSYGGQLTVDGAVKLDDETTAESVLLIGGTLSDGSLADTQVVIDGDVALSSGLGSGVNIRVESGSSTVSGTNRAYAGTVVINSGELETKSLLVFGNGTVEVNATGSLNLGSNLRVGSLSGTGGEVQLNGKTLTITGSAETEYAGQIAGNTGKMVLSAGALNLSGAAQMDTMTVSENAQLNLHGNMMQVNTLTNANKVTLADGTQGAPASLQVGSGLTVRNQQGKVAELNGVSASGNTLSGGSMSHAEIYLGGGAAPVSMMSLADAATYTLEDTALVATNVMVATEQAVLNNVTMDSESSLSAQAAQISVSNSTLHQVTLGAAASIAATNSTLSGANTVTLAQQAVTPDAGNLMVITSSQLSGLSLQTGGSLTLDLSYVEVASRNLPGQYTVRLTLEGFGLASDYQASIGDSTEWLQLRGGNLGASVEQGMSVSYTQDNDGLTVEMSGLAVPEPTTATLSLLGLAGLALRRRRRK